MFVNYGWAPHKVINNDEYLEDDVEYTITLLKFIKIHFKIKTKKRNMDQINLRERILMAAMAEKEIDSRPKPKL